MLGRYRMPIKPDLIPLSDGAGEVIEVNGVLADQPGTVNADPEGEGWFFKLKLDDPGEVEGLGSACQMLNIRGRFIPIVELDRKSVV